jgi:thiamine-phosphate pyrophosphorylase
MILKPELPRLLLVGDGFWKPEVADAICTAIESGVRWVHLRAHGLDPEAFEAAARSLIERITSIDDNVIVSINTRLEAATNLSTEDSPAIGVHLGSRGPSVEEARSSLRSDALIGLSIHTIDEIDDVDVDYFTWSPVYPTDSKPGAEGTGIAVLGEVSDRAHPIPVIAMGGISPENTAECLTAGAYGIAVLSGILGAEDIPGTVRQFQDAIDTVYPEN